MYCGISSREKLIPSAQANSQLLKFRMEWQRISIFPLGILKSLVFSTCAKLEANSLGINTSKIKELKPPEISTYENIVTVGPYLDPDQHDLLAFNFIATPKSPID